MSSNLRAATDLDAIIALGYPEYLARHALKTVRGDRAAAIQLVRRMNDSMTASSQIKKADSSWRGEGDDDWINYIPTTSLPSMAQNRALWKSPIYVSVNSGRTLESQDQVYQLNISLKDKRQWSVERTYSDFVSFRASLPIANSFKLSNRFPLPWPPLIPLTNASVEKRFLKLQEWLRELTLDESMMADKIVLKHLYRFIDADSHGGPVCIEHSQDLVLTHRQFLLEYNFSLRIKDLPTLSHSIVFRDMNILASKLPFKINLPPPPNPVISSVADSSDNQLAKDFSRDRIVVNGKRLLGSLVMLPALVNTVQEAIEFLLLTREINCKMQSESLVDFCKYALRAISRTESAFLSHSTIMSMIDCSAMDNPVLVVPESTLASPVEIVISIKERDAPPPQSPPHVHMPTVQSKSSADPNFPGRAPPPPPPPPSLAGLTVTNEAPHDKRSSMPRAPPPPIPTACLISTTDGIPIAQPPPPLPLFPSAFHEVIHIDEPPPISVPCDPVMHTQVVHLPAPSSCNRSGKEWSIVIEAQADTVFRIVDIDTMSTVLQLKTTYRKVIFGMPKTIDVLRDNNTLVLGLEEKAGSATVCFAPETRTTARDWKGDQVL